MPPTDDPLAMLFAPDLVERFRFALLCAYASGWSDAFGQPPLAIRDARLASAIEEAGIAWQSRLMARSAADVPVPPWLAALIEAAS